MWKRNILTVVLFILFHPQQVCVRIQVPLIQKDSAIEWSELTKDLNTNLPHVMELKIVKGLWGYYRLMAKTFMNEIKFTVTP